jgi:hypothetical protein
MPRIALDLNSPAGRQTVKGQWRVADGLVPGEPNEGLVSQLEASPARLKDYDDSKWAVCDNIRQTRSKGFTFCWWRITVQLPAAVDGVSLAGSTVVFETNVDNYGEVWVDGEIDGVAGTVQGNNVQQRVTITRSAEPGARYTLAVLAANGPFGVPRGGVFMRYATLAFETSG